MRIKIFIHKGYINAELLADILSISKTTLLGWEMAGKITPVIESSGKKKYLAFQLNQFEEIRHMLESKWDSEKEIKPIKKFTSIELFAGGGGAGYWVRSSWFRGCCFKRIR